ncbi:hypothetical protein VN24_00975 [Paenibacillus beijingensis]|uniref:Uncharacterized protein n=1 Tax=Paenibacillus beijingensis TaxID=1126833 RepID=A0A0D5NDY0_9BACL|nr:hypothetical protein VN24_00975 [Paenibacillus beijingensis]
MQIFFEEERSETIGNIAAEQFVDFMIKEVGPYIITKQLKIECLMKRELKMILTCGDFLGRFPFCWGGAYVAYTTEIL